MGTMRHFELCDITMGSDELGVCSIYVSFVRVIVDSCKRRLYDVAVGSDESRCAVDVLLKFDGDIGT